MLRDHPRLWIATLFGVAVFFCLPVHWALISRVLVGWNCGVVLFLVLIAHWMTSLNADQICRRYIEEDSSATFILVLVTLAAMLSVLAIVEPLAGLRHQAGSERIWHFVLALVTLINSWLLVPTVFTTYYADLFYSAPAEERPLRFPETDMPVFWDFAYFPSRSPRPARPPTC